MKEYVGVDIGGTKMYMLSEYEGKYIEKKVLTGFDVKKEYLKEEINDFIKSLPFKPKGIGMAMPGLVEGTDTVVISNVVPCLNGIRSEFFEANSCKVKFLNDVNSALLEEAAYYKDDDTIVLFMLGTGIAAAIKTNGEMVEGKKGWAGELGFTNIMVDEEVHTLDSLASGSAILKKANMDIHSFLRMVEKEDKSSLAIIKDAGFYFGIAMANMINLLNPNIIVVGGSTSTYKGYMETAIKTAKKYSLKDSFNCCKILAPKDINRMVALGARRFAFESDR